MDPLFLSRVQFALTSAFHYIYPPLSIGLGLFLVIIEGMYLKTGDEGYLKLTKFWAKIFGLTFALGVATGLVQVFGFGSNWANYSRYVGDVFGSALGAEGVFAFFLEAGFLGVVLFGWDRVSKESHYLSTILVCLGAHFSAIWIVVANSWMQTPTGYKIIGEGAQARAVVTNFLEMALNPSSVDRLTHVILGCWITGALLVVSVSAYHILKKKHVDLAKRGLKIGLYGALAVLVLQLYSADVTARGVAKHQPAKLAAMEGVFKTNPEGEGTALTAIGYVDTKAEKVVGWKLPGLLSMLIYRNDKTPVPGLDQVPRDEWPNVQVVFQSYHLMIAAWGLMFVIAAVGAYKLKRKTIEKAPFVLWALILSVFLPHVANFTGWMTAEVGRQPWVVYKLLKTADGVSPNITGGQVAGSITMFVVIYTMLFAVFIFLLNNKIQLGPTDDDASVYRDPYLGKK